MRESAQASRTTLARRRERPFVSTISFLRQLGPHMRRLVGLCSMAAILAGCGGTTAPTASLVGSAPASSAPASAARPAPAPSSAKPAASAARVPVQVFFTAGGKLVPEQNQVAAESPAKEAMQLLIKGPKDPKHFSEIPKSTQLLDMNIKDGTARASFDRAFFAPGGAAATELRLAQVVYTLTQFPTVTAVQFLQEGQAPPVIGEGMNVSRPLSRDNFSRLA
jgi:germination protein M